MSYKQETKMFLLLILANTSTNDFTKFAWLGLFFLEVVLIGVDWYEKKLRKRKER